MHKLKKLSPDAEFIILRILRIHEDSVKTIKELIPLEYQSKELWDFIISETDEEIKFNEIPSKFRKAKLLAKWVRGDYNRIMDIPKKYWNKELKTKILEEVNDTMTNASEGIFLSEKELAELKTGNEELTQK